MQQPMIQLEKMMMGEELFRTFTVNNDTGNAPASAGKQIFPVSFVQLLVLIFVTGSLINLCLLIRSHISLWMLIRSGRKVRRGKITIVLLDHSVTPFNFGHYIILSEKDYLECPDIILTHELAHYHFLHSFDIALVELLILLQWFNPIIRLFKKEIRKVHEFQADAEVLNTGIDATTYQLLLVRKAVNIGPHTFANSLTNSKLKIRFTMMSKKKSNRWARMKLLLLLLVAALFVYACARPEANRQSGQIPIIQSTTSDSESATETYPVYLSVIDDATGKELCSFKFENKNVVDRSSFTIDYADESINKLKEWFISQKKENFQYYTMNISADPETPMGVITDLKEIIRDAYLLNLSHDTKD
jgi:hypothetical protein